MAESKTTISLCVPSPDEWEYRQKLYLGRLVYVGRGVILFGNIIVASSGKVFG